MILGGTPLSLAKSLCVKLKKLTSEVVKNAKSKCEIEINELKVEDGEGEHDLEIDGTLVKMKTAFIKIKNRSTPSLPDLSGDINLEDISEVSLKESLDKILSEDIPSLGEGWRKEIIRKSAHEALIVCVKTPDNVELRSVREAKDYLNSVGINNVDVERLFSSPPTPSKTLSNEVVEHEVANKCYAVKDLSGKTMLDSTAENFENEMLEESVSVGNLLIKDNLVLNDSKVKTSTAVLELVEPDSTSDEAITTTTDSSDNEIVGDIDTKVMEGGDMNDNNVDAEINSAPLKSTSNSKKRKLVQTSLFSYMDQGQHNKKVKVADKGDSLEENNGLPTEVEITGNVINGAHKILEKVTDDLPQVLDDNLNVNPSDCKCLPDVDDSSEFRCVLEKVPEDINKETCGDLDNEHEYKDTVGENEKLDPIYCPDSTGQDKLGSNKIQFVKGESGSFQCQFCDYYSKVKGDMKKHFKRKHQNFLQLPCNKTNEVDSKLSIDLQEELKLNVLKKSPQLECSQCDISFKVTNSHEFHNFYVHGPGAELVFAVDELGYYQCDDCGKTSSQLSNIKTHVFHKHWKNKDKTEESDEQAEDELEETEPVDEGKIKIADKESETGVNIEFRDTVASDPSDDDDASSTGDDKSIPLESSDLPEGWSRLKVPRKAIGKFDVYVQSPDGKRFNCQKKIDVFIAKNNLKVKGVIFRPPSSTVNVDSKKAKPKAKKQPCKESNNIPKNELQSDPVKKKRNKELDKENKVEKLKREKKPKTEDTDMTVTDKEIDESEVSEEVTENELQYIAEIDQFMKETNLNLEPQPATKGDGNCWYRAAACQVVLHKIPNKPRNHKSMRLEVSNHLKHLPTQVKEDTVNVVYQGRAKGLTDLASRQRKAGQWVDNMGVMVLATAHYLGRNIHLYGYPTSTEHQSRLFSLTRIEGGDKADIHPPLTIFYYDRHYQTLQPVRAETEMEAAESGGSEAVVESVNGNEAWVESAIKSEAGTETATGVETAAGAETVVMTEINAVTDCKTIPEVKNLPVEAVTQELNV